MPSLAGFRGFGRIVIGKDLFHQFKLHQVFQVNTDLRPRKIRMQVQLAIDVIAQSEEGVTLIGICNWEKNIMSYADYEWLLFCAEKAKLRAEGIVVRDHLLYFSS